MTRRPIRAAAAALLAAALAAGPAAATTVAEAALDLTLSNFSASYVSWSQSQEPQIRRSRALGEGWAGPGTVVQAQNRSIVSASSGVDARSGAEIDGGESWVELVRTFTLVNPTPWLGTFGMQIDYVLSASVLGDVAGGVSGGAVSGEVGQARATLSFWRLDMDDAAGELVETAFYPQRDLLVDYGMETDGRFPTTGKAVAYVPMQVGAGETVHLRVVSRVSTAVYAAAGAAIPPLEGPAAAVPAPPALGLLGAALGGLGLLARRRRDAA
ncbi:hypothetical protein [Albimonas pacifica]|nr:hypothetical protein [Albimonas pacifica]